jgi:hypothetical protein
MARSSGLSSAHFMSHASLRSNAKCSPGAIRECQYVHTPKRGSVREHKYVDTPKGGPIRERQYYLDTVSELGFGVWDLEIREGTKFRV